MIRTYSELKALSTFEERFQYLRLDGAVGAETFGFDRIFNQKFYASPEWKAVRDHVIIRDNCCDLGVEGYEIPDLIIKGKRVRPKIFIHHMNPILLKDIESKSDILLDPEYLITTTQATHNAIHYGDEGLLVGAPIERSKNDTCPWKR